MNTPTTIALSATDADGDPLTYAIVENPAHGTLSGGGAVDGGNATITGSGFGSNAIGQEHLGGINGPVNGLANGGTFRSLNRAGWTTYTQTEDSVASSIRSYSGYKTLLNDTQNGAKYQFGLTFDTGAAYKAAYIHAYVYLETVATSPLQLKTFRFVGGPQKAGGGISDGDTPNAYLTQFWGVYGSAFGVNGGSSGTQWMSGEFIQNGWFSLDILAKPDSSPGAGDAVLQARGVNLSNGTVLFNQTFSGIDIWPASLASDPMRYLVAQFYMGNYNDGTNLKVYFDDTYFAWNAATSTTPKTVLLGNAATYATCTKFSLCRFTSWSDTAIQAVINKGPHSSLNGLYWYVMNGINTPLNPNGIALAGGASRTYTPTTGYTGSDSFTFKANDGTLDSNVTTVAITVSTANVAPVVAATIPNQTGTVGTAFSYTIPAGTFTDADGDTLTWSATGLPAGVSFTAATRVLAGTPTAAGSSTVTVSVNDGHSHTTSTTFTFTINAANVAPVVSAATATPSPVTATTTALSATASDDGGEANLTYTWTATGPAAVAFNPNGTNPAKASTATFTRAGSYTLTVTARDAAGLTGTRTVAVTVAQTAAVMSVSPTSASVQPYKAVDFNAVLADQFGANLTSQPTLTWSVSGSGGTIDANGLFTAGAGTTSPSGGVVATTYVVTASGGGRTATALVTVSTASTASAGGSGGGCGAGGAAGLIVGLGLMLRLRNRRR